MNLAVRNKNLEKGLVSSTPRSMYIQNHSSYKINGSSRIPKRNLLWTKPTKLSQAFRTEPMRVRGAGS